MAEKNAITSTTTTTTKEMPKEVPKEGDKTKPARKPSSEPVAGAATVAAPAGVPPDSPCAHHHREVKTKDYRLSHNKVSWTPVKRVVAKDPNMYYSLTLSALAQLRREKLRASFTRVVERVLAKARLGSRNVKARVRSAMRKIVANGLARQTSRGFVTASLRKKANRAKKARKAVKRVAKTSARKNNAGSKRSSSNSSASTAKRAKLSSEKAKATGSAQGVIWEYKERNAWHPYASEASDLVEAAYQDYKNDPAQVDVRSVKSGMWAYQVDFTNMTQTNIQHENHTVRDIRRYTFTAE